MKYLLTNFSIKINRAVLLLSLSFFLLTVLYTASYIDAAIIVSDLGSLPNSCNCALAPEPQPSLTCANGSSLGTPVGACGWPACTVGDSWTKYTLGNGTSYCFDFGIFSEDCQYVYIPSFNVCSLGDKCTAVQPYLNYGYPDCSTGACLNGGIYKTCCAGSNLGGSCNTLNYDNIPPPEGSCPSGTSTVMCGVSLSTCNSLCGGNNCYNSGAGVYCTTSACGTNACQAIFPAPTPIPNGVVQGFKVLMPGNQNAFPAQGQPVSVDGNGANNDNPYGTGATFANPTYWNNLAAGSSHTISVPTVAGYSIGYTLCYNDTTCHDVGDPITPGNSVDITVPTTGSRLVDLWWHYTQNAPDIPGNPTDNACVNRDSRARITWDRPAGATSFQIRVDEHTGTPSWNGLCNGSQNAGDICLDNVVISGNPVNYEFNVTGGKSYRWWVHACGPGGCGATSTERTFTGGFPAKSTCGPNPLVPAPLPGNPNGKYGDIDGDLYISCLDAVKDLQIVAGSYTPSSSQIEKGDVDDTAGTFSTLSDVNSGDATKIYQYLAGSIASLPVCTDAPCPTSCTDGTPKGVCSTTKPQYCPLSCAITTTVPNCNGAYEAGSPACGCPAGLVCDPTTRTCVTATIGPTPVPLPISGTIFIDSGSGTPANDGNGIWNCSGPCTPTGAGDEAWYSGASVNMSVNGGANSARPLTSGGYSISGFLANTSNSLNLSPPSGYTVTTANPRTVAVASAPVTDINFGIRLSGVTPTPAPSYTIYIHAYLDEGAGPCYHNKIQDCGETYPAPWRFATIGDPIGGNFNSYFAGGGSYTSGPLASGTWYAAIDYDTNLYELEDPINYPDSKTFTLGPNADINVPLLTIPTHSISGTIFIDNGAGGGTANDGIKNGTESPYPGTPVSMSVNGGTSSNRTLTGGNYTISGFAENQGHTINLTPPSGYVYSYSGANANYVNPRTVNVVTWDVVGINFGIIPDPGFAISGNVFIDSDNDCVQDAGEENFAGAALINQSGNRNLGYDVAGSSSIGTSDRIRLSRIIVPAAEAGSVSQGSIYLQGSTNNATVYMVVYDNVSSLPQNLIAVSNGVSVPTTQGAGPVTFTFPSSFSVSADQNLWIGMYADIAGTTAGGASGPLLFYSGLQVGDYANDGYVYVNDGDAPVPSDLTGIRVDSATQRSHSAYLIVSPSPTSLTSISTSPGYSFTTLSAGTYDIALTIPGGGYTLSPACVNPISKTVPPGATGADFGLISPYTISGNRVIDNDSSDTYNAGDANLNVACTNCISWAKDTGGSGTISISSTGTYSIPASQGTYAITYNSTVPSGHLTSFPLNGPPPSHTVIVGSGCSAGAYAAKVGASCNGANNVIGLNFGFKPPGSWYQCIGCDIRDEDPDDPFEDLIPATPNSACTNPSAGAYATLIGAGGTHGVVFTGTSYEFGLGQAASDPTNWHVWNTDATKASIYSPSAGVLKTSYDYMIGKFRNEGYAMQTISNSECGALGPTECTLSVGSLANNTIYRTSTNENLKINNPVSFGLGANKKLVFMVAGDLIFAQSFTIPPNSKSSVTFIVKGDIHVQPSVGDTYLVSDSQLDGYFSTDKSFILEGGAVCPISDERLNISGAVVVNAARQGGDFVNNRSLCTNNSACPVLTVRERPDFVINAPESIKRRPTVQKEVAP